jgi:hypothetical protein
MSYLPDVTNMRYAHEGAYKRGRRSGYENFFPKPTGFLRKFSQLTINMESKMKRKILGFVLLAVQLTIMNCGTMPEPSEPLYQITLPNLPNVRITPIPGSSSIAGALVRLDVTVTPGYQLSLTVKADSGENIPITGNSSFWSFLMPASDVTVNAEVAPPTPLTKDLLKTLNSELNIRTLNYYISEGITLINVETSELYSANDGAVIKKSRNGRETIRINKDTSGLMITSVINESNPIELGICFDEINENLVNFKENADGTFHAVIETDEEGKRIQFGSKKYTIQYDNSPQLLIQYMEKPDENRRTRVLGGRWM